MSEETRIALGFLERLAELSGGCAPTERFILQVLPGDPGAAADGAWRPRPWRPEDLLPASPERTNGYVAISTFGRAPDKSWRRQKALFAKGRAIMIDDVGTKVAPERARALKPTWRIETSPGNEQWVYVLRDGEPSREAMDAVLDGLVAEALAPADAKDPGMKGVTRVMRVPGFINGKPKHGGAFRVRWVKGPREFGASEPEGPTYTLGDLREAFALRATQYKSYKRNEVPESRAEIAARMAAFNEHVDCADALGLLARGHRNAGGWTKVRCPWEEEHSDSRDGADIREPAVENDYYGAFKCFHGHCEERGWREFTDFLDARCAEDVAAATAAWEQITEECFDDEKSNNGGAA